MDCIKDKVGGRGNDTSHLDPGYIPRILRGNERKCFSRVLKLSVHVASYQYRTVQYQQTPFSFSPAQIFQLPSS
jgi:hypothetical protein